MNSRCQSFENTPANYFVSADAWRSEGGDDREAVEFGLDSQKKRQISALALGPLGSEYLLGWGEPDHAWPRFWITHFSINRRLVPST